MVSINEICYPFRISSHLFLDLTSAHKISHKICLWGEMYLITTFITQLKFGCDIETLARLLEENEHPLLLEDYLNRKIAHKPII